MFDRGDFIVLDIFIISRCIALHNEEIPRESIKIIRNMMMTILPKAYSSFKKEFQF